MALVWTGPAYELSAAMGLCGAPVCAVSWGPEDGIMTPEAWCLFLGV